MTCLAPAFAGVIVVAPGEADELITNEQKAALDALHLRKIDLVDRFLVVKPGGYIGESTSREISYAHVAGREPASRNQRFGFSEGVHPEGPT
ncbi:hypothetical protein [Streptomyces sp. BPSDS2]|uniref:hypothetical protein n=1 Tax=Streptomyces sp. BPSDS2 TaxID=2571021 RepID=UPI0010C2099E|nr:hypothetical protein [Streptomyces sp. BPSDS2]